jgi:aspartate aminotransferase-like enzyme
LKGKVFRIATMGYITASDIIVTISALERALLEMGCKVNLGAGAKAAEEVFNEAEIYGTK